MTIAIANAARAKVSVDADAQACWRAFTRPESLTAWYAERVEGDVVEGSRIELCWDSLGRSIELEVLEASPPHRLCLRAQPPERPPQIQRVEIRPRGRDCEVEILHEGFAEGPGGEDERAGSEAGWRAALMTLARYIERYDGRSRVVASAVATSIARPEEAYRQLARAVGLGKSAAEGDRFTLELPSGRRCTGEVLVAAPPHHLLVALPAIEGVAALRTFPIGAAEAPESAIVAAQLGSWSLSQHALDELQSGAEALVARAIAALGGPAAEA